VLPRSLAGKFADFKEAANLRTPAVLQAALARFIRDGHLERHIYRMRAVYRGRRAMLIDALDRHFGGRAVIRGDEAGMHLLVEFPDLAEVRTGPGRRNTASPSTASKTTACFGARTRQIVLGYGNVREEDIEPGIERLSRFLRERG